MSNKINTYIKSIDREYKLNGNERKILLTLLHHKKGLTLKGVQEKTPILRLTLLYNLKKLIERELVYRDTSEKAHVFFANLKDKNVQNVIQVSLDEAYTEFEKSDSKRIVGIQGVNAIRVIVKTLSLNRKKFAKLHKRQKQRDVIIDTVLFDESVKDIRSLSQEDYRSHLGRPTVLHMLSASNAKLSNYEVISDGKIAIVTDRYNDYAVIIKQKSIINIIEGLLEVVANAGKKENIADVYGVN